MPKGEGAARSLSPLGETGKGVESWEGDCLIVTKVKSGKKLDGEK
jgi:hypothetical protein